MRYLILLLLLAMPVMADIEHSLPASAEAGTNLSVALQVSGATIGKDVIVGEKIPAGSTFLSWDVSGAVEAKDDIGFYIEGRTLVWAFTAATSRPFITYTITLPEEGDVEFNGVYALPPNDFGQQKKGMSLITANVIEQEPALIAVPPTEKRSWSWLVMLIALIGIAAAAYHYYPAIKPKLSGLQKLDVKKTEEEFSGWLHERIDHHKQRVAEKQSAQPAQASQPAAQQPLQSHVEPELSPQAAADEMAVEELNASVEHPAPFSVQAAEQFIDAQPEIVTSERVSGSDNDATFRQNYEDVPYVSFDQQQNPLRSEDYQYQEREKIN